MLSEFESRPETTHPKRVELTPTENVLREIEEYYKGTDLTSARFQAFADYIDYLDAKYVQKHKVRDKQAGIPLIEETIRQRKNGLMGYKKEFDRASQFRDNLRKAIGINVYSRKPYSRDALNQEIDYMQRIKDRLIDTHSQQ